MRAMHEIHANMRGFMIELEVIVAGADPGFSERGSEHRGVSLKLGGTAPQKL